jgi:hypothetical protein
MANRYAHLASRFVFILAHIYTHWKPALNLHRWLVVFVAAFLPDP